MSHREKAAGSQSTPRGIALPPQWPVNIQTARQKLHAGEYSTTRQLFTSCQSYIEALPLVSSTFSSASSIELTFR